MGDLSDHFSLWEFECHGKDCCEHTASIDRRIVSLLEDLRTKANGVLMGFDRIPLVLNSGFRCHRHNSRPVSEGGAGSTRTSQHPIGLAVDVALPDGLTSEQMDRLTYTIPAFYFGGRILHNTFIHLDIRDGEPYFNDRRT